MTVALVPQREAPRPLMRSLPPADPYPADALGKVLADAAKGIHEKVQAPLALCGQCVLGAAALAVQAHGNVILPFGQTRPVSLYLVSVAASSERKSTADTEALWPVSQHEENLCADHDRDVLRYINDKAGWEKARDEVLKKGKGNRDAIRNGLDALGPPPAAPLNPMLTSPEPTFEGLVKFLAADGRPSLGIFAAEGGQFIGGHSMSAENKTKTATGLSVLWDGSPIRRMRAGDGVSRLPGRRLSLHLMAQPHVASSLLADQELLDQGLLSRILLTAPETLAGTRFPRPLAPESQVAIKAYGAHLLGILGRPYPTAKGKPNELAPRTVGLSQEAERLWYEFAAGIERRMAPGSDLADLRGFAGKLGEHAARIAAVLALFADIDAAEIDDGYLSAGIALARHHLAEALRLYGASRIDGTIHMAQALLTWLQTAWTDPLVSLPDIYQRGPNAIRDKATASRLVTVLEDHGWLIRLPGGADVAGRFRKDAWRIMAP